MQPDEAFAKRREARSTRAAARVAIRGKRGFSIIEVMAGLTLFAVVASGLMVSSVGSMKATSTSREASAAATLIYDKVEQLRALDPTVNPADLQPGAHDDPLNPLTPLGATGGRFTRSWTVTANTPRVGLAEVVVTVTWSELAPRTAQGVTYVCGSGTCS